MQNFIYEKIRKELRNKFNIVGIHGPQGIGKSTLNKFLFNKFTNEGFRVLIISLDDFYLEYDKMKTFLYNLDDNLYNYRGLAGTHDLNLLNHCLDDLINERDIFVPTFNKVLRNGFGDRDGYVRINNKPNLIILEGWMLGYKPKNNIKSSLNNFNKLLVNYEIVQAKVNIWIILETDNLNNITEWRWNAEDKDGMNKDEFNKFMKPYFEIYNNYSINSKDKIILDKDRNIIN